MHYFYILITIVLTVYGQLVVKWQVNLAELSPLPTGEKLYSLENC